MKHILDMEFESDPREKLQKMKIKVLKGSTEKKSLDKIVDESGSEDEDDRVYLSIQLFKYRH